MPTVKPPDCPLPTMLRTQGREGPEKRAVAVRNNLPDRPYYLYAKPCAMTQSVSSHRARRQAPADTDPQRL